MLKRITSIAMFALLLYTGICGIGIANDNTSGIYELEAKVMSIDLTYNRIVIAEKEMTLLSHIENKKTVWDTRFQDVDGSQISPDRIKSGSRVLVRWEIKNRAFTAREIILLE